jgi:hypothetical protein
MVNELEYQIYNRQRKNYQDFKMIKIEDFLEPEYCAKCGKEVNGKTCYWDGSYRRFIFCEKCFLKCLEGKRNGI